MECITKIIFKRLHELGIISSTVELSKMCGKSDAYIRACACKGIKISMDALIVLLFDLSKLVHELTDEPETAQQIADIKSMVWNEISIRANAKLEAV